MGPRRFLNRFKLEIFNEDGTFRETVFYNTTGLDALKAALKAARRADPHAKLYVRRNPFALTAHADIIQDQ